MLLLAHRFDSGFHQSHDTYNALSVASDGRVYYVLCAESWDFGAKVFRMDPRTRAVEPVADLTEACGEAGMRAVPQSKSHVNFHEHNGKLYFATHVGIYSIVNGREVMPIPPEGYQPYPGGHFLSYDLRTGRTEDLGIAPDGEGILTFTLDGPRGMAYALTWPTGQFLTCDLATRRVRSYGRISQMGEAGTGPTYRTICRSLQLDPRDGAVYFTTSEGWIFRYRGGSISRVEGDDLRKDYFGQYDPSSPGHMGYNWRQTVWYEPEGEIYGVHGNSGYLFRFDPRAQRVDVMGRITSEPSQRCGMFDQFSYGYLGFTLGPDGRTLYYLTGGPIFEHGRRVAGKATTAKGESKGEENLHLVLYDIPERRYRDCGPIFFEDRTRPSYVNSIAVGSDHTVYFLSRVAPHGGAHTDLASVAVHRTL
jgi:hypothetical protein